jgi:hypothetical protein
MPTNETLSPGSTHSYTIRCEDDPTTYFWESTEAKPADAILDFEQGRSRRVLTINGAPRSRYRKD